MRSDALYNNYVHHLFYRIKQIQWPATLLQIQNLPIPHTRNGHPTALTLEGMKSLQVISHFDFPGNEQWMYICKAACVICSLHLKKMYNRQSKIVTRCTCFLIFWQTEALSYLILLIARARVDLMLMTSVLARVLLPLHWRLLSARDFLCVLGLAGGKASVLRPWISAQNGK